MVVALRTFGQANIQGYCAAPIRPGSAFLAAAITFHNLIAEHGVDPASTPEAVQSERARGAVASLRVGHVTDRLTADPWSWRPRPGVRRMAARGLS